MEKSRKHDTWAEKVKATQTEKSSPSSARREQGRPGPERLQDGAPSQGDLTQVTQSQAWSIGMIGENVLGRRPHAGKGGGTADGSPTTLPANQETLGETNSFQTKSVSLFSDCYRRSSEDYQGQHSWTADMGVWLEAGQVEAGSTVTGGRVMKQVGQGFNHHLKGQIWGKPQPGEAPVHHPCPFSTIWIETQEKCV